MMIEDRSKLLVFSGGFLPSNENAVRAETAADEARQAAVDAAASAATKIAIYDTRDAAEGGTVPGYIDVIRVSGAAQIGDGGATSYRRVGSGPASSTTFQSADGAWWKRFASKTMVLLATGQSNMQQHRAYPFAASPNVYRWNNVQGDMASIGTAFEPLSGDTMNPAISFANQVALDNPDTVVFLINVAKGAQTIDSWLPGAPAVDDVYQNIIDNMGPALAAAGASQVDVELWWQGESGGFQSDYPVKFEAVQSRLRGNVWFPVRTPTIIFGVTTTARTTEGRYDQTNFVLQDIAASSGENRQFVNSSSLVAEMYWNDLVHMSGLGYEEVGKMAAAAFAGKSRFVPFRLKGTAPYLYDADFPNLGSGLYQTDTNTLNLPGTFSGLLRNDLYSVNFQVQEVDQITTGKRWRRYRRAGVWTPWQAINGAVIANAQGGAAQAISGTTRAKISYPNEVHDPFGMWSGNAFTPTAGIWLITASVRIDSGLAVGERLTLQLRNSAESSTYLSAEVENTVGAAHQVMFSGMLKHTGGGSYAVTLACTGTGDKTVQLDAANTYFNATCIDGA